MRKYTTKIYILCLIIIITMFSGCEDDSYDKYSFEFFGTFDTIVSIVGYTQKENEFNNYTKYTHNRFIELNKMFDIYNNYDGINNIKTINDNAGIKPVVVSSEIIELIELSIKYNTEVSDKVNIAMGPVLRLWHDYRNEGLFDPVNADIPPIDELEDMVQYSQMDDIVIDIEESTVYLSKQNMLLDVGAIAKGYATEIVAQELVSQGFTSFSISSGGNVKTIGAPVDETRDLWSIGLHNPFYSDDPDNNDNLIDITYVKDKSVVSSGDYQRYYYADGIKYHHLIDPETLMPANYFRAITIITQDSTYADYLSTVIYLTPYEVGKTLVESLEDVEAYWIFEDGTVMATDKMKSTLKTLGGATSSID